MYQSQVRYSYDELALVELDIGGEEDSELDETTQPSNKLFRLFIMHFTNF